MRKVNALELRQSLRKIIEILHRSGEPVLVERGRTPVAVLITLQDFQERFVEKAAAEARDRILEGIDALAAPSVDPTPAVEILQDLRGI